MKSFKQYIRETSREPQEDNTPRTLFVTMDDLRDMLGTFEYDRILAVTLDHPEYNSITVEFFPQVEETDEMKHFRAALCG